MATINRDYGVLGGGSAPNNSFTITPRRLVYLATHGGDDTRLPFMNRSFISFTFGGKHIEDFDLIATVSGDRMERNGYAEFEDTVSTYDNLDGLYYWSTHYKNNLLNFNLSTDGIDLKKLDDFLYWFKAGAIRELILAEHPNRGIMARVAEPPSLSLLPFEEEVEVMVINTPYKTKTTLYKGDISLSLIMDEPHWYSIVNILGNKVTRSGHTVYDEQWKDANGNSTNIFATQDALKIIYEDNIPTSTMILANMLLGNGAYANVDERIESCIWNPLSTTNIANTENLTGGGACINGTNNNVSYVGIIAGALVDASDNGIETLAKNANAYFFYSGTAPAPTIISFRLLPHLDGYKRIDIPKNSCAEPDSSTPYNIFVIESLTKLELRFTTPNFYTSYNKAVLIFRTYITLTEEYTWELIREFIRDQVRHPAIRSWAMKCIEYAITKLGASKPIYSNSGTDLRNLINTCLSYVLTTVGGSTIIPILLTFNSETGEATGTFNYRLPGSGIPNSSNIETAWANYGTNLATSVTEDVGDMLLSNYIIIKDRNYFTDDGSVAAWTSMNDKTRLYSHRIYHNVDTNLSYVQILYKNMYL